jgi:SAM-dependent methyltransferase
LSTSLPQLSAEIQSALRCPICGFRLEAGESVFSCHNQHCAVQFPVVGGKLVLLNEERSLFSIAAVADQLRDAIPNRVSVTKEVLRKLIPSLSRNVVGAKNFMKYTALLLERCEHPKVLVVGGKNEGEGFQCLLAKAPPVELVETDVVSGPRTMLICDSHDIPFEDACFDGVVVQAVLEHVLDPHRCVEEIFRVLRPSGLIYAEVPFIQQVHEGRFDFTRFTHLGLRRLFRRFEEIDSGAVCGTGMALAWSYRYFLLSLTDSRWLRSLLDTFARFTSFFWKYFDGWSIQKAGSFDAASAYYFLGQKSDQTLPDRELIKLYRGRV